MPTNKPTPKPTKKSVAPVKKTAPAVKKATGKRSYKRVVTSETPEERAYRKMMEKYKWDVTRIPGYDSGKTE